MYSKQSERKNSAYCSVNQPIYMDSKPSALDSLMDDQSTLSVDKHHKTILSYHKLKLSFICMLFLNALLLLVVIICMVLIIPHASTTNSDVSKPDGQTSTAHMKCLSIKQKLNRLYRNGQMVDDVKDNEKCSMEDLLDSFIQHVEDAMQREKSNISSAFHLVSNNTEADRCQDSRTLYCLKNWKLSINTTKITVNNESIVVPSSGAYFLYSRVVVNAKLKEDLKEMDTITHSIRYSNTGEQFKDLEASIIKCGVIKNTMSHISYIEKIQYLEKDSLIKVALDMPRDVSMQTSIGSGAFGMFKL